MDKFSVEDLLTLKISEPRRKFIQFCFEQRGKPYIWGAKGPDTFDCSGLVTCGIFAVGGGDLRSMYNAQKLFNQSVQLMPGAPQPGDLAFYGLSSQQVTHVAIFCAGGKALDACGGDSTTTSVAIANKRGACVMIHPNIAYRRDLLSIKQNVWLAALEKKANG